MNSKKNMIMKKEYITPEIQVIGIRPQQILQPSPGVPAAKGANSDEFNWNDGGMSGDDDDV